MYLPVWSAAVLHIKVFVYGVVRAVVYALTQFESVNDLVVFTIHQFDRIGIASVRDYKAVGLS